MDQRAAADYIARHYDVVGYSDGGPVSNPRVPAGEGPVKDFLQTNVPTDSYFDVGNEMPEQMAGGGLIKKLPELADKLKDYIDPAVYKISDWSWRPMEEVGSKIQTREIPDYIQKGYGEFMTEQAGRAQRGEMGPRDLIKSYLITQSSIGRGGLPHSTATKTGMRLPDTGGEIRPEGAFAEWLGSKQGQKYLDDASRGVVNEKAIEDLRAKFAPFGKQNDLADKMIEATKFPGAGIDLNAVVTGDKGQFQDFAGSLKGIAEAKPGFIGSLIGRGDLPTLDARQLNLHAPDKPPVSMSSIMKRGKGEGGKEAIERLIARQNALEMGIDPALSPHYQHLTHHAIWDEMGKSQTTHEDLIKAMRGYAGGGLAKQFPDFAEYIAKNAKRIAGLDADEKKLPIAVPRAEAMTDAQLRAEAERIARQETGQHVTSGEKGDTVNLAGRSQKEAKRVQDLEGQYLLERSKKIPTLKPYEAKVGDINIAIPGDLTISDYILREIQGLPIGSLQQGGAHFGLGRLGFKDPYFWASNQGPATGLQNKISNLGLVSPESRIVGQHMAMGQDANNFAQHFADANLKAAHAQGFTSKAAEEFNKIIREGTIKQGKRITFPDWPGIENQEAAYKAMQENGEMRKWFNNRMKTPKVTDSLGLPNGLDIQWAISEPKLRNMEVNLVGASAGKMKPGTELGLEKFHNTYSHGIRGEAIGPTKELYPFEVAYPDVTSWVKERKRPQDFTGTIQKIFPHQIVDEQQLNQLGQYEHFLRQIRGYKKGGEVESEVKELPPKKYYGAPLAAIAEGLKKADQFARAPFGYDNPPAALISDLLSVPAWQRTLENVAYGFPVTTGSGVNTQLLPDAKEVAASLYGAPGMAKAAAKAAPAVAKGAKAATRAALEPIDEAMTYGTGPLAKLVTKPNFVVKPKGGNWITDQRNMGLERLKPADQDAIIRSEAREIEKLQTQIADLENRDVNPASAWRTEGLLGRLQNELAETQADMAQRIALNKWLDTNLANYVKKQMGTPEDPVRKLAEEGVLHMPPQEPDAFLGIKDLYEMKLARKKAGFPEEGMAVNDAAKFWENIADDAIGAKSAKNYVMAKEQFDNSEAAQTALKNNYDKLNAEFKDFLRQKENIPKEVADVLAKHYDQNMAIDLMDQHNFNGINNRAAMERELISNISGTSMQGRSMAEAVKNNPWIGGLAPDTQLYTASTYDLGFDHIRDVLIEDLKAGRIRPEQLSKVSMEQAVRRTHEYDLQKAAEMEKTVLQQQSGFPVYKEYPEGYRWLDLATPDVKLPEGATTSYNPKSDLWEVTGPSGNVISAGATEKEAINLFEREKRSSQLEQALKYEGDTMGHCVGNYCYDVESGRTKIYSLRDSKGQPHVTIEARPGRNSYYTEWARQQPQEVQDEIAAAALEYKRMNPGMGYGGAFDTVMEQRIGPVPNDIIQIKGKGNRAPKEDYLPFVQDFVKSGEWGNVNELRNAGLRDLRNTPALNDWLKSQNMGDQRFVTEDEYKKFEDMFLPDPWNRPPGDPNFTPDPWNNPE